jgi:hypothetical protein
MKRPVFYTFVVFCLFAAWGTGAFAGDISFGVEVALAGQEPGQGNNLKQAFNFSSYDTIEKNTYNVSMGREQSVPLIEGKTLVLTPLYYQGNTLVVNAKVLSGYNLVVDTQFRVSPGGSFMVGGIGSSRGTIIVKVTVY